MAWITQYSVSILKVNFNKSSSILSYGGKLAEGNFRELMEKNFSAEKKKTHRLLGGDDTMLPNFMEKTFTNSHKASKFAKGFLPESFPLYGSRIFGLDNV